MKLSDCFAKAGDLLTDEDRQSIQSMVDSGMSESTAITSHLRVVNGEIEDFISKVKEAGVEIRREPLKGAPGKANIPNEGEVEIKPSSKAIEVAKAYMERMGLTFTPISQYTPVDVERAEKIAREYDRMEHAPNDPLVKAAYEAMVRETSEQFREILKTGLKIEFIRGDDPYADSPYNAVLDIERNNHLWVFSTRDGFGTDDTFDPSDSPLLSETEFEIDGVKLLANDVFRIVHDYFGHYMNGVGFRAAGEENAWQAHASMYTPLARRAMTSETRGQNSWLNFGPYGESNRTAKSADTVFADQKTGLLPVWVSEEGSVSGNKPTVGRSIRESAAWIKAAGDNGRITLHHFSRTAGITRINPAYYGGNQAGAERDRSRDTAWTDRTYYGVSPNFENGYQKEPRVGSQVYTVTIDQGQLYDYVEDPLNLREGRTTSESERAVLDAGYSGYIVQHPRLGLVAAVFDPLEVQATEDTRESTTLFQQSNAPRENPYYSGALRAVETLNIPGWKNDGGVNGQEIWHTLAKTSGVRTEELEWSGLQDWLTATPNKKFTRNIVLNFIESNGPTVQTIVKDSESPEDGGETLDWDDGQVDDDPENWRHRVEDYMYDFNRGQYEDYILDIEDTLRSDSIGNVIESSLDYVERTLIRLVRGEFGPDVFAEQFIDFIWFVREKHGDDVNVFTEAHIIEFLNGAEAKINELMEGYSEYDLFRDGLKENFKSVERRLRSDIEDKYEEAAESVAEQEYMDEPYVRYSDGKHGYSIYGSDAVGEWRVFGPHGHDIEITGSVDEAKIEAHQHAVDNGLISVHGEGETQWGENRIHVGENLANDSYREVLLTSPESRLVGKFDDPHWNEEDVNVIGHWRGATYENEGDIFLMAEEIQTDLHSEGSQHGYMNEEEYADRRDLIVDAEVTANRLLYAMQAERGEDITDAFLSELFDIMEMHHPRDRDNALYQAIPYLREAFRYEIDGAYQGFKRDKLIIKAFAKLEGSAPIISAYKEYRRFKLGVPDAPFKKEQWVNLVLKNLVFTAASENMHGVAWAHSSQNVELWGERYRPLYENIYDKTAPKLVEKLIGVKPVLLSADHKPVKKFDREGFESVIYELTDAVEELGGAMASPSGFDFIKPRKSDDGSVVYPFKITLDNRVVDYDDRANGDYLAIGIKWDNGEISYLAPKKPNITMDLLVDTISTQFTNAAYWYVPLSDELKDKIRNEGFTLFQGPRGALTINEQSHVMRLSQSSDLSTFLHESAHFFLEVERRMAKDFGVNERQREMLNWLGVGSFDQITRAHHEKFAESFELYLREGNAPSVRLKRVFGRFKEWLKRIYQTLERFGNLSLDDEGRQVFSRLLASEDEIDVLAAADEYSALFESREKAGMSATEWDEYQEIQQRKKQVATDTLDEKLLKELRRQYSDDWKELKAPLVEKAMEELQTKREYALIAMLAEAPMDQKMLRDAIGNQQLKKFTVADGTGIDPGLYAEQFGFTNIAEMYAAITNAPSIKKAANEIAEQQLIATHGDILNDGTIEEEARVAMMNEENAKSLMMEIKALSRQAKSKSDINRDYLKAEADRFIRTLTYKQVTPGRFYRQMVKAAKDAATATDPLKQRDAKVRQLTNHYLYKAATDARKRMENQRRYIRRMQQFNPSTTQVRADFVANIRAIAELYDMKSKDAQRQTIEGLLSWYETQLMDANSYVDITLVDVNLLAALEQRRAGLQITLNVPKFDDLTGDDLQGLHDQLKHLRFAGGTLADEAKASFQADVDELAKSIMDNGGKDVPGTRGIKQNSEEQRNDLSHWFNRLSSLRNLMRKLDGFKDGAAFKFIFREIENAGNEKLRLNNELFERFRVIQGEIAALNLTRKELPPTKLDNGNSIAFTAEARFMLGMYWGTESSRQAIRDGFGMTDNDVMNILSGMTKQQLETLNTVWQVNESLWPDLSSVSVQMFGIAPPKLPATPFIVNGVTLTGGHMRLFYDSTEIGLEEENKQAAEMGRMLPSRAGSTYARVGSGGRPPSLDINNITRAYGDNLHFIAYAKTGKRLRGLLNNKEVRSAIERKHGTGFYKAMVDTVHGVVGNQSHREVDRLVTRLSKLARHAATMRYLAYSIRNVVQQGGALPIAAQEVGTVNLINAYLRFAVGGKEYSRFVKERSVFMRNRTSLVNREANEYLQSMKLSGTAGLAWRRFQQFGFAPQQVVDALVAYPVWMARYEQEMEKHGDEALAISNADTSVSESVGSGTDLHLGGMFQQNNPEFTKLMTAFGSWFNSYYQRIYRDTRGFTGFDWETFQTIFTTPFIVAVLSALLVMDGPGDDEDWLPWAMQRYASFMGATVPLLRDIISTFSGFTPKTALASLIEVPANTVNEIDAFMDDRQDALKTASDISARGIGVFVPIPGLGNITRALNYLDSYDQGKEGSFNPYQMMVEGPDRNK